MPVDHGCLKLLTIPEGADLGLSLVEKPSSGWIEIAERLCSGTEILLACTSGSHEDGTFRIGGFCNTVNGTVCVFWPDDLNEKPQIDHLEWVIAHELGHRRQAGYGLVRFVPIILATAVSASVAILSGAGYMAPWYLPGWYLVFRTLMVSALEYDADQYAIRTTGKTLKEPKYFLRGLGSTLHWAGVPNDLHLTGDLKDE